MDRSITHTALQRLFPYKVRLGILFSGESRLLRGILSQRSTCLAFTGGVLKQNTSRCIVLPFANGLHEAA